MFTSIKQMTGTENFLSWPTDKRGCSLEKYENCQKRVLKRKLRNVDAHHFNFCQHESPPQRYIPYIKFSFQVSDSKFQTCSPSGMRCIQQLRMKRLQLFCGVACKGIYADISDREILLKIPICKKPLLIIDNYKSKSINISFPSSSCTVYNIVLFFPQQVERSQRGPSLEKTDTHENGIR